MSWVGGWGIGGGRGTVELGGSQVCLAADLAPAHTCTVGACAAGVGPAARAFSSSSVEHLHVIWERVTCGSHQAEERLNQGLITVCLEGSGPK